MAASLTPMMAQYFSIKEEYKDCILMFRLGDFYEMFYDDALTASAELEITLTGRSCGEDKKAPMCGVPFHAADGYIARLVAKGYKVAICEQAEDPKLAKGLVKREVIRIITPGTILDDGILNARKMNYMCCVCQTGKDYGVVFADVSTGEILGTVIEEDEDCSRVISELERFSPVEVIFNLEGSQNDILKEYLANRINALSFACDEDWFDYQEASLMVEAHFKAKAEEIKKNLLFTAALGALMRYLTSTQKVELTHITDATYYKVNQFMDLDTSAQRNLELMETMRDKQKRGTLLWVLDKTCTSMGLRVLKKWILRPLLNVEQITQRHLAVQELCDNIEVRDDLTELMGKVYDIERLMGKVSIGTANPRDLVSLKASFENLPQIKQTLKRCHSGLLTQQARRLDALEDLRDLIDRSILDEPPVSVREGGIIKAGYHEEIDRLNMAKKEGKGWIAEIEATERENTGIKNLKVGFNKVFGYYIEVSNGNLSKVPDYFIRKQTLTNGERFITPKLKEVESTVLGAEEKIVELEYQTFISVRDQINSQIERVQRTAHAIGTTDVLCSFATVASKNNYCMPSVDQTDVLEIKDGRHPVVEQMLTDGLFVPNDTRLNTTDDRMSIITGPNMAGKSTYMRQVALITLMAQIGSFVPASSCRIGIVDKIFTRVGASDNLAAGQSTFMVEMSEVAYILKNATRKSLLILDEIGRGTSTYDGLAIAWAVIEYCCNRIGAKTLFATHYHELTELEGKLMGTNNYCVAVRKRGDDIIFLRKIIRGGADQSYGIEVAKIAGVSDVVIKRAKVILEEIEQVDINRASNVTVKKAKEKEDTGQLGFTSMVGEEIVDRLKKLDVSTLSPIEAINVLYELTKKVSDLA